MVAPRSCGLALSPTAVVVSTSDGSEPWRRALTPIAGATWPALTQILREGAAAGVITAPVRVALMPPLAEVRTVSIPPVSDDDARRLLTRAASRHFVSATEAVDVAVTATGAGTARLAAAVSSRVLRAVLESVREAQLQIDLVVPAQVALSRAQHAARRSRHGVLAEFDDAIELLTLEGGALTDLRRFRRSGDDTAIADASRAIGDTVRITDPMHASAAALTVATSDGWPMVFDAPSAASFHGTRNSTASWALFGAAAMLAIGTVALQEYDVRRELAAVRAERATLTPKLTSNTVDLAERVARLSGAAPHASSAAMLAALGDALPTDAYLTRLRAQGDTLIVEGQALRATGAFEALSAAAWVRTIAASAPVRRETTDDGTVTEKFEFTITVRAR